MRFKGVPVSDGISVGRCKILKDNFTYEIYSIDNIEREQERFKNCILEVKRELLEMIEDIESEEKLEGIDQNIFKAHVQILEDPMFYTEIFNRIKSMKKNVEWVINKVVEEIVDKFKDSKSEVLRDRAVDIKDVGFRVITKLTNKDDTGFEDLDGVIIVAEELTPSQLLHFAAEGVSGICTESGGITSHVAIFSRSLEIPALTGVKNIVNFLTDGEYVVLDTEENEILFNLTEKELNKYIFLKRQYEKIRKGRKSTKRLAAVTKDGKKINIAANISIPMGLKKMQEYGIKNIGLYRTEYLFMDRTDLPGEDEQFKHYKKIGEAFKGDYLVLRTLDAGGDKNVAGLTGVTAENNPFLGWRGIRICLDRIDIFKSQIKAVLRAAAFANIKIMYPMVSSPEEYMQIQEIFQEVVEELKNDKVVFNENIEQGILLEVPSAVLNLDYFVEHVDFFSIGTNDLLQFLLAVDRTNTKISDMYSWYNKALFKTMKYIVDQINKKNKSIQVCGEIAGDPLCLPVLIGLGIHSLSMVPAAVPKIKLLMRSFSVEECKEIASAVLKMDRDTEIKSFLSSRFKEFMGREEVINEMSEVWKGK